MTSTTSSDGSFGEQGSASTTGSNRRPSRSLDELLSHQRGAEGDFADMPSLSSFRADELSAVTSTSHTSNSRASDSRAGDDNMSLPSLASFRMEDLSTCSSHHSVQTGTNYLSDHSGEAWASFRSGSISADTDSDDGRKRIKAKAKGISADRPFHPSRNSSGDSMNGVPILRVPAPPIKGVLKQQKRQTRSAEVGDGPGPGINNDNPNILLRPQRRPSPVAGERGRHSANPGNFDLQPTSIQHSVPSESEQGSEANAVQRRESLDLASLQQRPKENLVSSAGSMNADGSSSSLRAGDSLPRLPRRSSTGDPQVDETGRLSDDSSSSKSSDISGDISLNSGIRSDISIETDTEHFSAVGDKLSGSERSTPSGVNVSSKSNDYNSISPTGSNDNISVSDRSTPMGADVSSKPNEFNSLSSIGSRRSIDDHLGDRSREAVTELEVKQQLAAFSKQSFDAESSPTAPRIGHASEDFHQSLVIHGTDCSARKDTPEDVRPISRKGSIRRQKKDAPQKTHAETAFSGIKYSEKTIDSSDGVRPVSRNDSIGRQTFKVGATKGKAKSSTGIANLSSSDTSDLTPHSTSDTSDSTRPVTRKESISRPRREELGKIRIEHQSSVSKLSAPVKSDEAKVNSQVTKDHQMRPITRKGSISRPKKESLPSPPTSAATNARAAKECNSRTQREGQSTPLRIGSSSSNPTRMDEADFEEGTGKEKKEEENDGKRGKLLSRISGSFRSIGKTASFRNSMKAISKQASKLKQMAAPKPQREHMRKRPEAVNAASDQQVSSTQDSP